MTKTSYIGLLIALVTAGCGGGSPPPQDPADTPEPEPVEVIENDTGATNDGAAATGEGSDGAADESAASAADESEDAEVVATSPGTEEALPSSDLQSYVGATTGYTPEYRTVMDNMDTFKQCYLDAMRANPDISGMLTVRFTVLKTGKVQTAKAVVNELNDEVASCILKALKKIKFPKRADKRTVEYPFKFIPSPS